MKYFKGYFILKVFVCNSPIISGTVAVTTKWRQCLHADSSSLIQACFHWPSASSFHLIQSDNFWWCLRMTKIPTISMVCGQYKILFLNYKTNFPYQSMMAQMAEQVATNPEDPGLSPCSRSIMRLCFNAYGMFDLYVHG